MQYASQCRGVHLRLANIWLHVTHVILMAMLHRVTLLSQSKVTDKLPDNVILFKRQPPKCKLVVPKNGLPL